MGCSKVHWVAVGAALLITLITIPVAVYLNRADAGSKRSFTLADYFNDTIRWRSYNLRWISDNEYLHKTRQDNVLLYNVETNEETLFLSNETFARVDATDYGLSGDHKYICFESNYTKQWRHSYTASYSIYDMDSSAFLTSVSMPIDVQYFSWAPEGNKFAYIWNFNIYLKTSVTDEPIQVTHNGKKNEILNGVPDWVYEEEVFASNEAMWWSTKGRFLAYLELNDTEVQRVEFSWYGSGQYPETVAVPYPKAGSTIPKVKLLVVDTTNPSSRTQVAAPAFIATGDHYLSTVTWVTDERIAVQWLTRKQNYVLVQIYDFDGHSWVEKQKFEQTSKTGWVGHYSPLPLFFAEDNLSFYKVMSNTNGYKHIHYVQDGKVTPLTSGKWEVIYISKLTKDSLYYVSNEYQGRPGQRNMYKIMIGPKPSAPQCLTCDLRKDKCQYNSAYFSKDASYFRMDCYGPGLPLFTLRDNRGSGAELKVLEDNKELENILTEFHMPTMQRGTLRVAGFDLWYQMMLPPNFTKTKKYPLLIDVSGDKPGNWRVAGSINNYSWLRCRGVPEGTGRSINPNMHVFLMVGGNLNTRRKLGTFVCMYGGPCSQKTDFRFLLNWGSYLSSTEGIIVASFDGRGSGYQGDAIMHSLYQRLGTFEVEDQITAVRKFIDMGFIDEKRIAIWGWSYGGYVSSMALGAGTELFKCGIAVAPVSKWEYYDAVYTERYMSKPTENYDSYQNSTVISRARNFKSVNYLLVHGTADDNVHFQQAAQISKALVDAQVDFEAMWYADKDHGLRGSAIHHVYTHMSHFLQKCLVDAKQL